MRTAGQSKSHSLAASMGIALEGLLERLVAVRAWAARRPRASMTVALALIVGLALVLRLWGVNWDDNHHLHPDERFLSFVTNDIEVPGSVGSYFDSSSSTLSPYNRGHGSFVYGTFPLFATKLTGKATDRLEHAPVLEPMLAWFLDKAGGGSQDLNLSGYDGNLVGRVLSALFDTGTVVLVFLTGSLILGRRAAFLAAFLAAVTVFHIQLSHFYAVDTFLTFFTLLTIYFSIRISKGGGWPNYTLAGAAYGFALASKIGALPLAGVILLAVLIRLWPTLRDEVRRRWPALRPSQRPEEGPESGEATSLVKQSAPAILGLLLTLFAAFVVFRVVQPYAFEAPGWSDLKFWSMRLSEEFRNDMRSSLELQSGQDFPPNIQWIGRTSYLFPLKNMVVWGMGVPLGLAAWGGFLYAGWRFLARGDSRHLLLLAWVAVSFAYWGGRFNPIMRSFLPIYPALILLGAFMLTDLWQAAPNAARAFLGRLPALFERWRPAIPIVLRATVAAVVVLTFLWALAFTNIYRRPVSRVEAGQWVSENVPQGSVIAGEHWDDGLPITGQYQFMELEPYAQDSAQKVAKLIDDLDRADYITLTSNRVYASIPRIPAQYPVTTKYYDLLFAGELGFRLEKEFTSYPTLFGISIPDQGAEESFTVYDHPKVHIFEKTPDFSRERLVTLLQPGSAEAAVHVAPKEADQNALLLRPKDLQKQQSGGTWSDIFNPGSLTNRFPLVTWLLVVEVAALALVPLAMVLFRSLPDGGYLLTKPLAVLALAYPVWLGASLKVFDFTRTSSLVVLLVLVAAGAVAAYRMRGRLRDYVRQHWRLILFGEALFLLAFLIFYFIRLSNPDLWHAARGGEKPMDFAYLNAVVRSTTLPPYDPWFGGGYINYYYFGHFMTANLTKLTGILPEVAYNLAVPLFFAVSVAAAFSVGYNLAEASRRLIRRRPGWLRIPPWTAVLAGLTAALLVTTVGNLKGADVQVDRLAAVSPWQPGIPVVDSVTATVGGGAKVLFAGADLGRYDYWAPSRAILTDPGNNAITEFPFFTFLFADLHAHLMAIPFTILSLGLGLALVLHARSGGTGGSGSSPSSSGRLYTTLALVGLLGLVVGALRWINSWDYPTFLIMALAAVFIAEWARVRRVDFPMLLRTVLLGALLAVLSWAFFQPFSSNYALPATGFQGMPDELPRTPFHQYLSHFGFFIFLVGSLLAFLAWRAYHRVVDPQKPPPAMDALSWTAVAVTAVGGLLGGWAIGGPLPVPRVLAAMLVGGTVGLLAAYGNRAARTPGGRRLLLALVGTGVGVFAAAALVVGLAGPASGRVPDISITDLSAGTFVKEVFTNTIPVAAFSLFGLAVVALVAWGEFRTRRPDAFLRLLVLAMVAMALLLSAGVEVAVLDPDIGRQNTVFKFYLQIWILLALASSFAVWYLAAALAARWDSFRQWLRAKIDRPSAGVPRLAFTIGLVALLLAALVYPIEATRWRVRLDDRAPDESRQGEALVAAGGTTNNGLAFMQKSIYHDEHGLIELKYEYDAIVWLRDNVVGSPVIMEANTPLYRLGSRISIYTGLPAVVGWEWHQMQQRGQFAFLVQQRAQDVSTFYSTPDPAVAEAILQKYGVSYVIVGQVERLYYPAEGIAKFDVGAVQDLEPVYSIPSNPPTVIYHVVGTPGPRLARASP